jgi:hypothetical protein
MWELMGEYHRKKIGGTTEKTYWDMVQVRNNIDDLKSLLASLNMLTISKSPEKDTENKTTTVLRHMPGSEVIL